MNNYRQLEIKMQRLAVKIERTSDPAVRSRLELRFSRMMTLRKHAQPSQMNFKQNSANIFVRARNRPQYHTKGSKRVLQGGSMSKK